MTNPADILYGPLTLRRLKIIQDRQELLYAALNLSLTVSIVGLLLVLYILRRDILDAIEGSKS